MDVQLIRSFVEVAHRGSVTGAARDLGFSQPAVTAHLRALERLVRGPLFLRSQSGTTLTELGLRLLPHATALLDEYERMLGEHDDVVGHSRVTVGYWPPPLRTLLDRLTAAAARHLPRVRVSLSALGRPGDIEHDVLTGRHDLHVVTGPVTDPRLAVTPLFPLQVGLRMSAGHPLADHDRIRLEDTLGFPTCPLSGVPWKWEHYWLGLSQRDRNDLIVRAEHHTFGDCLQPLEDIATVILCPSVVQPVMPPGEIWLPVVGCRPVAVELARRAHETDRGVVALARFWRLAGQCRLTEEYRPSSPRAGRTVP